MEGIYIPKELLECEELTITECFVLAVYKYYTENGKSKCCHLSDQQIADIVKKIKRRQVINIKNHLKELGFIKTDTNNKIVYYVGVQSSTPVQSITPPVQSSTPHQCNPVHSKGAIQCTPKVQSSTLINVININKENKELNKEFKKEGVPVTPMHVKEKTNFDLLMEDRQLLEFNKPKLVEYFKQNHSDLVDKVNNGDFNDYCNRSCWIKGIKDILTPVMYSDNSDDKKEEPKSDITKIFDEKQNNGYTEVDDKELNVCLSYLKKVVPESKESDFNGWSNKKQEGTYDLI